MNNTIYDNNLNANSANYESLSPLSFLVRAAEVNSDKPAIRYGTVLRTWKETYHRCIQLAHALSKNGIEKGDTVSIMCPNLPEHYEAHFGIPMSGAVINSINTRLDSRTVAYILRHCEAKIVLVDLELYEVVKGAVDTLSCAPKIVLIEDPALSGKFSIEGQTYEQFLAEGSIDYEWVRPVNEWDAISLNYTSGTTGDPKGVVYHHRGAYLNAVSNVLSWEMNGSARYLWTLPMFHCNGWCFPWSMAQVAGLNICLRAVKGESIVNLIESEKVDHFCAAPIVLSMISELDDSLKNKIQHPVKSMTAGAPPPASVIGSIESLGISVTHVYGLTETYGPCVVSEWRAEWDELPTLERARLKSRQGVRVGMQEGLMVAHPDTTVPVPKDGKTLGEVMMRGNVVMKGYLKSEDTTSNSFSGGWFHSGDLAIWNTDGYIELKDRSKDIIISGGENISSIEIENVLFKHPFIISAAVVAQKDKKWGEVPCAYVTLKDGDELTESEVIEFCKENMPRFKIPKKVVFGRLPMTSTGKVQKFLLRKESNNS